MIPDTLALHTPLDHEMETKTVVKRYRQTDAYAYACSLDGINKRMIVHEHHGRDVEALVAELFEVCRRQEFGKLLVQAREAEWQTFLGLGFQMEGTIESFFSGEPVYYMSKFFCEDRRNSEAWLEEERVLERVLLQPPPKKAHRLPAHLKMSVAGEQDVLGLVRLFDAVFDTYPSPLTDPAYLAQSMQSDVFVIVRDGKRIVSAAGAEIDRAAGNAEMTNCATLPEFRRYGLMNHIFVRLEEELLSRNVRSLYSIARAKSYGMNRVLHQHGYEYRGRLVNNCDICGGFEDMNLWAKRL